MDAATVGVAQKEDQEEGIDEQDMFDSVVLLLPTITPGLCSRVLGADDPPFRPVMGTRGATGGAGGPAPPGVGSATGGVTTVAASASETPKRCAKAVRERAGASPRVRRAVSTTGKSTWIH
jgi:hypothetical protein